MKRVRYLAEFKAEAVKQVTERCHGAVDVAKPKSDRTLADEAMLISIKRFFEESQGIYGSPRVHRDLREEGIRCGEKRVVRLMQQDQLRSVRG